MTPPMREIVDRIGRHAVRLNCGHIETLSADAIGRRLPCERCAAAGEGGLSITDLAELHQKSRRG